jgi:hypothetical protein
MDALPVTPGNTVLPLALVLVAVIGLPWLLTWRRGRSQRALLVAVIVTALAALVLGAAILFAQYARLDPAQSGLFAADPVGRGLFFLGRSALLAMFWAPVLALVWIMRAQGVERRKGLEMGRGDGKRDGVMEGKG